MHHQKLSMMSAPRAAQTPLHSTFSKFAVMAWVDRARQTSHPCEPGMLNVCSTGGAHDVDIITCRGSVSYCTADYELPGTRVAAEIADKLVLTS